MNVQKFHRFCYPTPYLLLKLLNIYVKRNRVASCEQGLHLFVAYYLLLLPKQN